MNFLRGILSHRSLSRTTLITLLNLKCVRKSEELKVKDSKCSGWNKFTMTLNESICIILTKKISPLKVHELNLYLARHGIVFKGKKPEIVAYIKAHIARRILSGIEKGTPLCEETLTSGLESDVQESIVGSETSSTLSSILCDTSDSPALLTVVRQRTVQREHRLAKSVACHGRTRRRKKKDRKS